MRWIVLMLLIVLTRSVLADPVRIHEWILDINDETVEAYTANGSGSVFGILCYGETCDFYLDAQLKCEEQSLIPMLINAESGSTFVTARCVHLKSKQSIRYVTVFSDKDVVNAISSGVEIGFAVPLNGGQFKVVRFSLSGALEASGKAVDELNRINPRPASRKLKDTTM